MGSLDIELTGVRYPQLVHGKGYSSIMVGQDYSSGLSVSGIIKQITLLANSAGVVRVRVTALGTDKFRTVLILPTGAAAEIVE